MIGGQEVDALFAFSTQNRVGWAIRKVPGRLRGRQKNGKNCSI